MTERGGERFELRSWRLGYQIVRLVDDTDFPGVPFWVEAEIVGHFRTKDEARAYMIDRRAPSVPS
jgi:hypothetical protein